MKKMCLALVFTIAYAIALSICLVCLLNLFGIAMAISLDGSAVAGQYPRFIPFCLGLGIVALATIIVTFILNLKVSEKFAFTKLIWATELIAAFVISIPMLKPWIMLFEFLQKIF